MWYQGGMSPSLIFDKSFLQSLNVDEAVILDQLFSCVITPLFFAETLGTLAKQPSGGKVPEAIVSSLAEKTPVAHSYMQSFHSRLMLHELLGMTVEMKRRPALAGGTPVTVEGKAGIVFKKSPEAEAFERWQDGRFHEVEQIVAGMWREKLGTLDLPGIAEAFRSFLRGARPKSHEEAKELAKAVLNAPGHNYKGIVLAFGLLGFPAPKLPQVIEEWKKRGRKPLREYAPYTAHCLLIDLYFYLALSNGLISDQRASNKIDIGYLYYLPFGHIFVSGDRLHRTTAELFLEPDQRFAWGPHLKADLAALNTRFLSLPEAEKARGLFTLVTAPPLDHAGLVAELWDKTRPGWRTPKRPMPKLSPEQSREIIERGKRFQRAAKRAKPEVYPEGFPEFDQLDSLMIERQIPRQRGSWRMFSEEVERQEDQREAADRAR